MKFAFKSLIVAGLLAGGLGTGVSNASAMPIGLAGTKSTDTSVHAEKAAIVCIGGCYRRFGYYRPAFRGYRAYRPYAFYRGRPIFRHYRY